jgi:hypothetical protein
MSMDDHHDAGSMMYADLNTQQNAEDWADNVRDITNLIAISLTKIWKKFDSYNAIATSKMVLVDLTVDTWGGLLTKLLISKYLSWHHGVNMCGIFRSSKDTPYFTKKMFEAFGGKFAFNMAENYSLIQANTSNIRQRLTHLMLNYPTSGQDLRGAINAMQLDGLPIGDLIYDSYLRNNGRHTIDQLDQNVIMHVLDGIVRFEMFKTLVDGHQVVENVTCHTVYNYMGMLTRVAGSRGIPTIQDIGVNPIRLRRLSHFTKILGPLERFDTREFAAVKYYELGEALAFGRNYMKERMEGRRDLSSNDAEYGAYGKNKINYTKGDFIKKLKFDNDKPIVCIMSHVLYESPHSVPGKIFNDIYEWLSETLSIAARCPHIQWLVKPHPDQKFYDEETSGSPLQVNEKETFLRLLSPYAGCSNISLCPPDISNTSLMSFSKAVVTDYGSAGYEFASQGVPIVISSRAPYAGLGFTIEPHTRQEYAEALTSLSTVEPLNEKQREASLIYIYLFHCKSRCRTTLLPDFNVSGFWGDQFPLDTLEEMADRISHFSPDDDPLFDAIRTMLQLDTTSLNLQIV